MTGFSPSDVQFTGSTVAGTLTATVTGSGAAYTVAVTAMASSGTVMLNVPAGAALDAANQPSLASTNPDNVVTYDHVVLGGPHLIFGARQPTTALPGGVTIADEDLASVDLATGEFAIHFDGSDVLPALAAIDALAVDGTGSLILSFRTNVTIPGLVGGPTGGVVAPQDLVRFTPSALGPSTAGTFSFYFDGSDVGLTQSAENIDALAILADGSLLISTTGAVSVTGVSARRTDVLRFVPTSLGSATAGVWSMYFDGSDVGLAGAAENIDGLAVLPDGELLMSTTGYIRVPGARGRDEDVLLFTPASLGPVTAGTFSLYFDGSAVGFTRDLGNLEWRPR